MDSKMLKQGADRYGTPLYVFDTDLLEETVAAYRSILAGRAELCFAMKANPFLLQQMGAFTDRIEMCSMGEFQICRTQGIPPEKILFSGVLKKEEDVQTVLDFYGGRCRCSVESPGQFQAMAQWGQRQGKPVSVYLRLSSGSQFGMDEPTVLHLLRESKKRPFIRILGLHYFSGTQKKPEKRREELQYLDRILEKLEQEAGIPLAELEYGPGLSVPYFQGQEDTTRQELQDLADQITALKWKGRVTLEMGRAFSAACGYYLTRVRDTKMSQGVRYCLVDGGIHQLQYDGQICGMRLPQVQVISEGENKPKEEWCICGSLCTFRDVLAQRIWLQGVEPGTVLVFENAGAYSHMEGMSLFLSHELPRAAVYSRKNGWRQVRAEQPTYQWNMDYEGGNATWNS